MLGAPLITIQCATYFGIWSPSGQHLVPLMSASCAPHVCTWCPSCLHLVPLMSAPGAPHVSTWCPTCHYLLPSTSAPSEHQMRTRRAPTMYAVGNRFRKVRRGRLSAGHPMIVILWT